MADTTVYASEPVALDSTLQRVADALEKWDGTYPKASNTVVGIVKVDGTTITVDEDGTIHGSAQNDLKLTIVDGKLNATYTKETS